LGGDKKVVMKKRGLEEKELAGKEKRWLGVLRAGCDGE
jgi:hypothetical protein